MSGPAFMRPYGPHVAHIIKQSDETRNATPVAITDDLELVAPVKPSTVYEVRIVIVFSMAGSSPAGSWRPACTNSVDFAALIHLKQGADLNTEKWLTGSASDMSRTFLDTTAFNAGSNYSATTRGAKRCTGMIQTSSSGGTFSVKWGGANGSRTVKAGSFMYLQEALAV